MSTMSFSALSNADLLVVVKSLANDERQATATLIASLMELDARRLYLGEGCSSLFTYCTQVLHFSEHAAYGRIEAARAARRFPIIVERLSSGELTLTAVGLLAPHLTAANHLQVLEAARHKTKRDVEQLVAALRPRPDVPASVRPIRMPKATPPSASMFGPVGPHPAADAHTDVAPPALPPPTRPPVVVALAPERFKVQFTMTRETHDKLRRAQDLLRHQIPNGDPAIVFDRALTLLLEQLEKTKIAIVQRPRRTTTKTNHSRHIPAAVKRAVWTRDGGRCAFMGSLGRCTETALLEFHHVVPYAAGGETSTKNVELRCRAHNVFEAELHFGPRQPTLSREQPDAYG